MKKLLATIAVVSLAGCSTMFNEPEQQVILDGYGNHNVPVSILTSAGTYKDVTPAVLKIQPGMRSSDYIIQVDEPCYGVSSVVVKKELAASYWLNSLNIVGFFIDFATGAMWNYEEKVMIPLQSTLDCGTASN